MKLTDEKVAKALGWKRKRLKYQDCGLGHSTFPQTVYATGNPKTPFWPADGLPAFTTSLDAIVAEIEARGLAYEVCNALIGGYYGTVGTAESSGPKSHADTAPLALCAALLAYLKEHP